MARDVGDKVKRCFCLSKCSNGSVLAAAWTPLSLETLSLDAGRAEEGGRGAVSQPGCAGGVRAPWLTHFTQPHLL